MKKITFLLISLFSTCIYAQTFELVKDINPAGDGSPSHFFEFDGKLFFSATDDSNGKELWTSDGTNSGTFLFKDINATGSSNPSRFHTFKDKLYFSAQGDIWSSDGTVSGTQLLSNDPLVYSDFISLPDILVFVGTYSTSLDELWGTDGTTAGTQMIKEINNSAALGSNIQHMTKLNDKVYFPAFDDTDYELWVSDGTTTGTQLVKNIYPGNNHSIPQYLFNFKDKIFFSADDGVNGRELWATDGTTAGTILLKDINPTESSNPHGFIRCNNQLFFIANGGDDFQLWHTDGTTSGTQLVKVINPSGNADFRFLLKYKDLIYFSANDGTQNGRELWKSDGTAAGTKMVKNINPTTNSSPDNFFEYNGKLFFTAIDGTNGRELWMSDGTNSGTVKIAPAIAPNFDPLIYNPLFTEYNNSLFFKANFTTAGNEFWKLTIPNPNDTIIDTTSIFSLENYKLINVFPNPSQSKISIDTDEEITNINIIDIQGKHVLSGMKEKIINIEALSKGTYFIKIETDKDFYYSKFVKN